MLEHEPKYRLHLRLDPGFYVYGHWIGNAGGNIEITYALCLRIYVVRCFLRNREDLFTTLRINYAGFPWSGRRYSTTMNGGFLVLNMIFRGPTGILSREQFVCSWTTGMVLASEKLQIFEARVMA